MKFKHYFQQMRKIRLLDFIFLNDFQNRLYFKGIKYLKYLVLGLRKHFINARSKTGPRHFNHSSRPLVFKSYPIQLSLIVVLTSTVCTL